MPIHRSRPAALPLALLFALLFFATLLIALPGRALLAESSSSAQGSAAATGVPISAAPLSEAQQVLAQRAWNYGAFFNGGLGVGGNRTGYKFVSVGVRAGKVLSPPAGPGLLRGQFEYSAEVMPWWQGDTPRFQRYFLSATDIPGRIAIAGPYSTGGTYNGASITPIILRWDLAGRGRLLPFVQGAGGLIWTNHKFPPVGPFSEPGHQATSVFNFTPQFGIGFQYFVKPRRSITFNANAVHISNASLGDANPGVNASVQFQLGYSWWK